jgi:spermidine synthase
MSAFILIEVLGLPGTILVAAAINLAIVLVRGQREPLLTVAPGTENLAPASLFLTIAAATGFASFLYEIAWIRTLSLMLSSAL